VGPVSLPSSTGERRYSRYRESKNEYPKYSGQKVDCSRSKLPFLGAFFLLPTTCSYLCRSRHWKWAFGRKEYELKYNIEGWKVGIPDSQNGIVTELTQATLDDNTTVAAEFSVPFRPHLFGKPEPSKLHLSKTALQEDEVFLLLVLIYSEAKRQDKTVCSCLEST
jgi:hypothetical protein